MGRNLLIGTICGTLFSSLHMIGQDRYLEWAVQPIHTGITEGKPFHAEFEEVSTFSDGREHTQLHGNIARDSRGRVRLDYELEVGPGHHLKVSLISDPENGTLSLLDHVSKTVTEDVFAVPVLRKAGAWLFSASSEITWTEEKREIEGLSCRLVRVAERKEQESVVSEVWLSDEWNHVVESTTRKSDQSTKFRLFNLSREEPDDKLFTIPGDYALNC